MTIPIQLLVFCDEISEIGDTRSAFRKRRKELHVLVDSTGCQDRCKVGVWGQAVHNMCVSFNHVDELASVSLPEKDVTTIASFNDIFTLRTHKIDLFDGADVSMSGVLHHKIGSHIGVNIERCVIELWHFIRGGLWIERVHRIKTVSCQEPSAKDIVSNSGDVNWELSCLS